MTLWFHRRFNGVKRYCSRSVSVNFYPQHWRECNWRNNGTTKKDPVYDFTINFFGVQFSYTNWDYNK